MPNVLNCLSQEGPTLTLKSGDGDGDGDGRRSSRDQCQQNTSIPLVQTALVFPKMKTLLCSSSSSPFPEPLLND